MNAKPILIFLCAVNLAAASTSADLPNGVKDTQCPCQREVDASRRVDSCCAATAGVPYSKDSIYQLDGRFTDDSGRPFALGSLRGRPVVLDMFFASCGYACPLTVSDMQAIRAKLPAAVRDRTVFVLVSFDVARDTPAALAQYRARRGLDNQWVLLHGDDDSVRELAALLGVKYTRAADGSFSHSNLITFLNPQGEIAYQRTGLQGGLDEAAAALVVAAR